MQHGFSSRGHSWFVLALPEVLFCCDVLALVADSLDLKDLRNRVERVGQVRDRKLGQPSLHHRQLPLHHGKKAAKLFLKILFCHSRSRVGAVAKR